MSDLYNRSLAFAQDKFRQETEKRGVMLNAQNTPKKALCCRCMTKRNAATGKQTARGFVCHQCHAKKVAKSAVSTTGVI